MRCRLRDRTGWADESKCDGSVSLNAFCSAPRSASIKQFNASPRRAPRQALATRPDSSES